VEEKAFIIKQLNEKLSKLSDAVTTLEEEKKKLQQLVNQSNERVEKLEKDKKTKSGERRFFGSKIGITRKSAR